MLQSIICCWNNPSSLPWDCWSSISYRLDLALYSTTSMEAGTGSLKMSSTCGDSYAHWRACHLMMMMMDALSGFQPTVSNLYTHNTSQQVPKCNLIKSLNCFTLSFSTNVRVYTQVHNKAQTSPLAATWSETCGSFSDFVYTQAPAFLKCSIL